MLARGMSCGPPSFAGSRRFGSLLPRGHSSTTSRLRARCLLPAGDLGKNDAEGAVVEDGLRPLRARTGHPHQRSGRGAAAGRDHGGDGLDPDRRVLLIDYQPVHAGPGPARTARSASRPDSRGPPGPPPCAASGLMMAAALMAGSRLLLWARAARRPGRIAVNQESRRRLVVRRRFEDLLGTGLRQTSLGRRR